MTNMKKRVRCCCFRLSNPTDEQVIDHMTFHERNFRVCRYIVFQLENPSQLHPHVQGYVEFRKKLKLETIKKMLPGKPHVEPRRSKTQKPAIDYVTSEYDSKGKWKGRYAGPWEYGKKAMQGQRQDIIEMVNKIKDGTIKCVYDLYQHHFAWNTFRYLERQLQVELSKVKRNWEMEIHIFYGKTGCGKTYEAYRRWPNAFRSFVYDGGKMWWQKYKGEETIVIDEFHSGLMTYQFFKRLCDRTPMEVPIKGSSASFVSKRIVITTNVNPSNWYFKVMYRAPLLRRINAKSCTIYDFKSPLMYRKSDGLPFPRGTIRERNTKWHKKYFIDTENFSDFTLANKTKTKVRPVSDEEYDFRIDKTIPASDVMLVE